jgi:3-oxoadipate enol-lactonase
MGPSASEEVRQLATDATAQLHVESYIKTVRASAAFSRVDNLVNIKVPTLLLFGDVDPLTPPSVGEYMQERIAGSQLVILENAGHMTNLEQPEAFNSAVLNFLRDHRDLAT